MDLLGCDRSGYMQDPLSLCSYFQFSPLVCLYYQYKGLLTPMLYAVPILENVKPRFVHSISYLYLY